MSEDTQAAKEEAMTRVDEHADSTWKECADAAIWILAHSQMYVSSDEVSAYVAKRWPDVHTHEPRALGPVMLRAARARLIEKHGFDYHPSASRHHAPAQVWKSLVFEDMS